MLSSRPATDFIDQFVSFRLILQTVLLLPLPALLLSDRHPEPNDKREAEGGKWEEEWLSFTINLKLNREVVVFYCEPEILNEF